MAPILPFRHQKKAINAYGLLNICSGNDFSKETMLFFNKGIGVRHPLIGHFKQ